MAKEMTIGEVARQAGIRPSAIRYYESMHVLPPPRLVNTKRRYTAEIFLRLALIKIAQEAGLTVAEMRLTLNDPAEDAPERWRALAHQKLIEVEKRMQQLARMKYILEEALRQEHLTTEEAVRLFRQLTQENQGNAADQER